MKRFAKFALLALLVPALCLALDALAGQHHTYHPFFYPNADNLVVYERGPVFYTLEDAQVWIRAMHREHVHSTEPDHEIGIDCRSFTDATGMNDNPFWEITADELEVCKETL